MALSWVQPHKGDRPQDFLDDRCERGLFRCVRCNNLWPLPVIWQDGFRLCQRCWDPISAIEATVMMGSEKAANASAPFEMLEFVVTGDSDGVGSVTSITPIPLSIGTGGTGTITIGGVNLVAADTCTLTHFETGVAPASATITPTIVSAKKVTLLIAGGGDTAGDYNVIYNLSPLLPRRLIHLR